MLPLRPIVYFVHKTGLRFLRISPKSHFYNREDKDENIKYQYFDTLMYPETVKKYYLSGTYPVQNDIYLIDINDPINVDTISRDFPIDKLISNVNGTIMYIHSKKGEIVSRFVDYLNKIGINGYFADFESVNVNSETTGKVFIGQFLFTS